MIVQPGRRNVRLTIDRVTPVEHTSLSDVVLVVRARDGDDRAMEELVRRHQEDVQRLAAHLLRDPEDARDAAQESLEKLCARIGQYRGEAQFSTWLHRLVVNTCRDVGERQRTRTHEPLPEELGADVEHDPARGVRISELRRELCQSLEGISAEQAQVIVLKDALGYTFEEIAAAVGMPIGTAKCHAHRGRSRLREQLEDRDVA